MGRVSLFWGIVLAAAIVVAGTITASFRNEVGRARAALSDGRTANTMAVPIEYAEQGAGMPLLSIHGAGGGYDQGLANAADFAGDGFRVIAPSRFGYLGTPIPQDTSPAAQADAIAILLNELKTEKAVVVGVSAGARSALELALRHPEKVAALILIVPGTYAPSSPVMIEDSRGSRIAFWLVNAGADFAWWTIQKIAPNVLIRFLGVNPELVAAASKAEQERVMHIVSSVQPLSLRVAGINIDSNPDLRRLPLDRIQAPTLVVSARDDLFNTLPAAEFAAGTIPNARLVIHETGGHLLVGHEDEVRAVISQFLAKAGLAPVQSR
jgi:2-hydroxy-6-oxonona-2,4-dienedioate hydrolase